MSLRRQKWLFGLLIAANLAFIWGNSALPADASGAMSGGILAFLSFLPDDELTHNLLRKAAHFAEFACLGGLVGKFRLLSLSSVPYSLPLVGLAVACVDETIQIFVPGRASGLGDVWIDTAGFTVGLIVLYMGYHIFIKSKQQYGGTQL